VEGVVGGGGREWINSSFVARASFLVLMSLAMRSVSDWSLVIAKRRSVRRERVVERDLMALVMMRLVKASVEESSIE
jgi:hypothetical protein